MDAQTNIKNATIEAVIVKADGTRDWLWKKVLLATVGIGAALQSIWGRLNLPMGDLVMLLWDTDLTTVNKSNGDLEIVDYVEADIELLSRANSLDIIQYGGNVEVVGIEGEMEVLGMPAIGNTVRLRATFRNLDGELESPTGVVVRIYNNKKVQIGEDIPVTAVSVGVFEYDYEVPKDGMTMQFIEFCGKVGDKDVLVRETLTREWLTEELPE